LVARDAAEPLAGTASHARGCIVFAYPKRLWHRNALASAGLPDALLEAFAEAEGLDVVTRFVSHERADATEITFYPQGVRFSDVRLEDAAGVITGYLRGERTDGVIAPRPTILVCTHGQRDRCCARFGLALVRALEACEGVERVEVREASHLGGDRFAPTAMIVPSGHVYGHLVPDDAPSLLRAALGGEPLLARFRGSFWREPREQLAEVAAFGLPRLGGHTPTLSPIEAEALDDTHAVLRCHATWGQETRELAVRCVREERRVFGDCRALEAHRTGGVEAWRIEEVRVLG
jgi:hypothetical protein